MPSKDFEFYSSYRGYNIYFIPRELKWTYSIKGSKPSFKEGVRLLSSSKDTEAEIDTLIDRASDKHLYKKHSLNYLYDMAKDKAMEFSIFGKDSQRDYAMKYYQAYKEKGGKKRIKELEFILDRARKSRGGK